MKKDNEKKKRVKRILSALEKDIEVLLDKSNEIELVLDEIQASTRTQTESKQKLSRIVMNHKKAYHALTYLMMNSSEFDKLMRILTLNKQKKKKLTRIIKKSRKSMTEIGEANFIPNAYGQREWFSLSDIKREWLPFKQKTIVRAIRNSRDISFLLMKRRIKSQILVKTAEVFLKNLQLKTSLRGLKEHYIGFMDFLLTALDSWHKDHREMLFKIFHDVEINASTKILDLGCGTCHTTERLQTEYSLRGIFGLDLNPNFFAVKYYGSINKNITFLKSDGTHLPFKDYDFDVVVCLEVIEHVEDYQTLLDEISRVLKPKGFLVLSTPDSPIYKSPHHLHNLIDFGILEKSLPKSSFSILRVYTMPFSRGISYYFLCQRNAALNQFTNIINTVTEPELPEKDV